MAENISVYWGQEVSFAELTSQKKKKKEQLETIFTSYQ